MNPISPRDFLHTLVHLQVLPAPQTHEILGRYQSSGGGPIHQFLIQSGLVSKDHCHQVHKLRHQGYYHCSSCGTIFPSARRPSSPTCPQCHQSLPHYGGLSSPSSPSAPRVPLSQGSTSLQNNSLPSHIQSSQVAVYPVLGELGKGGFGEVWQVQDPLTKRKMAFKVLKQAGRSKPRVTRRFLREIQITANLEHPHIMPVYECGYLDNGSLFYSMKELHGGTLKDLIEGRRETGEARDFREEIEILIKVCRALEYAHARGIVHRDLKPSNIAVGNFGEVVVLDWGLAKAVGVDELEVENIDHRETDEIIEVEGQSLTMGNMLGTPGYMAPEQARGEEATAASDIHALGATLYQILTSKLPYRGTVSSRLVQLLQTSPADPVTEFSHLKIPSELAAVAMKCLEKEPADRYEAVADLRRDLTWYLEGFSVSAKRDSVVEMAVKWVRRNKALAGGMAVAVLAVMATVAFVWIWEGQQRSHQVEVHLEEARSILSEEGLIPSDEFREKYRRIYETSRGETVVVRRERKKLIERYMAARQELEQAFQLAPDREKVRKELLNVVAEIGRLALLGKNFLLAETSFARCSGLDREKGKKLLDLVRSHRKETEEGYRKRAVEIMDVLAKDLPDPGMVDEYVIELVRMGTPEVVKVLLSQVNEGSSWPRLVAIEALGKIGDLNTRHQGRDSVEILVEKLEGIDVKSNLEEGKALVWALGRLGDSRAYVTVFRKRKEVGLLTNFSRVTKLPSTWIPSPPEVGEKLDRGKKAIFGRKMPPLYLEASTLFMDDKFEKALAVIDRLIEEKGFRDFAAYRLRGQIYMNLNRYKPALVDMNRAARLMPSNADNFYQLGELYRRMGKAKLAVREFTRALSMKDKPSFYSGRSMAYALLKKYQAALADIEKVLAVDKDEAQPYLYRGFIYLEMGRYKEAEGDLKKALAMNPQNGQGHYYLGKVYLKQKQLNRAIDCFGQALRRLPNAPYIYVARAQGYLQLRRFDQCFADCNRALTIDKQQHLAYYYLGRVHLARKKYSLAVQDFNRCLAIRENYYLAYFYRGFIRFKEKKYRESIEDHRRVLEIRPDYHISRLNLSASLSQLGRVDEAIQVCTDLIAREPKFRKAYYHRAMMYIRQGKKDLARRDLKKYLEIAPTRDPYRQRAYQLLRRLGQ